MELKTVLSAWNGTTSHLMTFGEFPVLASARPRQLMRIPLYDCMLF